MYAEIRFSFTNFGRKRAVMLLSDGMGTGKKAYEDSRRLIETLEDLLELVFPKNLRWK